MNNKIDIIYSVCKLSAVSSDGVFSIPYDTAKYKDSTKLRCMVSITKGMREYLHMGLNISTPTISGGRINFTVKEKYLKSEYNYFTGAQRPGGEFSGRTEISKVLSTHEQTLVFFSAEGNHFALNIPNSNIDVGLKLNGANLSNNMYEKAFSDIFWNAPIAVSCFTINSPKTLSASVWGGSEPSYRCLYGFDYSGFVLREKGYSCSVDVMLMEVS